MHCDQIGRALQQAGEGLARGARHQVEFQLRVVECLDEIRVPVEAAVGALAEAHHDTVLPGQHAHVRLRALQFLDHECGRAVEPFARRCRVHAVARALKQVRVQSPLGLAQPVRERRLSHAEALGGVRHVPDIRDRADHGEVADFQAGGRHRYA